MVISLLCADSCSAAQNNPERKLEYEARKRGRAVEGTGLENRRRSDLFVSSNLTASAIFHVAE